MEFGDLGKHCHICKQIDFLPFFCEDCQHYYCLDHRDHGCLDKKQKIVKKRKKIKIKHKCSYTSCSEKYIETYKCKKCHQYYCLVHRFHGCNGCL